MSIIQLKDGAVIDIHDDSSFTGGCQTCNNGAFVIQNLTFDFSNRTSLTIEFETRNQVAVYVDDLTKYLINHIDEFKDMTIAEFTQHFLEYHDHVNSNYKNNYEKFYEMNLEIS